MVSSLSYANLCCFWWSSESRSLELSEGSAGDRVSCLSQEASQGRGPSAELISVD